MDHVKSSKCDKQLQYLKQPTSSDHIIIMTVVQKKLNIVRLETEYTVLLNTLTMKQLTTSLYLISDSTMLHPLKRYGNHSSRLTRPESLIELKRFLW